MTKVMLSSTTFDLPDHRALAREAILQQDMVPMMMENLPASGMNVKTASLQMVEDSDVYILIIGVRYGTIWEDGEGRSITEHEYDFASRTNKKLLVFIASGKHPFARMDYEDDAGKLEKLQRFTKKVSGADEEGKTANLFGSAEDLKGKILNSLSHLRNTLIKEPGERGGLTGLPDPPDAYIPHP